MATEVEVENFLALYGLRRVRAPSSGGVSAYWNVYKGERYLINWSFDAPIEYYLTRVINWEDL